MNKLYQWFWFYIAKRFTKRKSPKGTAILLDDYSDRFFPQISTAKKFGDIDLVIFGDSNGEELADYKSMKRFPKIALNFSIGGTRADHWADFFVYSGIGIRLYNQIKNKKVVINVGGNNVLQDQMYLVQPAIEELAEFFPNAYWINVPSVYGQIIADLKGRKLSELEKDLKEVNELIGDFAKDRLIDIRPFTGENEVTPYFFVLKDAVHYSDIFDKKIRIPLIIEKVYGRNFGS